MDNGVESERTITCPDTGICRSGLHTLAVGQDHTIRAELTVLVVLFVPCRITTCVLWLLLMMATVTAEHVLEETELGHRGRREEH